MKWKDDPATWENISEGNTVHWAGDMEMNDPVYAEIIQEPAPTIQQSLADPVAQFWAKFTQDRPELENGQLYGVRANVMDKITVEDGVLLIPAFATDYATIRFKNSLSPGEDMDLTDDQRAFLDNLMVVGVSGYLQTDSGEMLYGVRSGPGAREGLIETVPQGLAKRDISRRLGSVLVERAMHETDLNPITHVRNNIPTHINVGPTYGDFTVVYSMELESEGLKGKVRAGEGHSKLFWQQPLSEDELRERRYKHNPVTVKLLEKLREDGFIKS